MSLELGDADPSEFRGGEGTVKHSAVAPNARVTFDRRELKRIFGLYVRKVASGEWRDYAIDFHKDRAVFSVFRSAAEVWIYRIEKIRAWRDAGRLPGGFRNRPDRRRRP